MENHIASKKIAKIIFAYNNLIYLNSCLILTSGLNFSFYHSMIYRYHGYRSFLAFTISISCNGGFCTGFGYATSIHVLSESVEHDIIISVSSHARYQVKRNKISLKDNDNQNSGIFTCIKYNKHAENYIALEHAMGCDLSRQNFRKSTWNLRKRRSRILT